MNYWVQIKIYLILFILLKAKIDFYCAIINTIVTISNKKIKKNSYIKLDDDNGLKWTFLSNYDCNFTKLKIKIKYSKFYYPEQVIKVKTYKKIIFKEKKLKRKLYQIELNNLYYYRNFDIIIYEGNFLLKYINFKYDLDFFNPKNMFSNKLLILGSYKNDKKNKIYKSITNKYYYDFLLMMGNNFNTNKNITEIDNYYNQNEKIFVEKPILILPDKENNLDNHFINIIRYTMPFDEETNFDKIKGFEKNLFKDFDKNNFKNNFYSLFFNYNLVIFINNDLVNKNIISIEFLYNWIIYETNKYNNDKYNVKFKIIVSNTPFFCSTNECFINSFKFKSIIDLLIKLNFCLSISSIDGWFEISDNLNQNFKKENIKNNIIFVTTGTGGIFFKKEYKKLETIIYKNTKTIAFLKLLSTNNVLHLEYLSLNQTTLFKKYISFNIERKFLIFYYPITVIILWFILVILLYKKKEKYKKLK